MVGPASSPSLSRPPELRVADRSVAAQRPRSPADGGPPLGPDELEPMPSTVTFGEFLAALNPLHHIPGVSWVYRKLTGETIQPVFRVLGGLVIGGPIGAIVAAVGSLVEELFSGGSSAKPAQPATAVASQPPAPAPSRSLAELTTTAGTPLRPLPLATQLAARAYPAPALPPREAAPPPDPAVAAVAAAAALPAPARERDAPGGEAASGVAGAQSPGAAPVAPPGPGQPGRIRRAPILPITSGGQDPAFVQRMLQGLEAYERVMRSRTAPAPAPAAEARP